MKAKKKDEKYWASRFQQLEKAQHEQSVAKTFEIQKQIDKAQRVIEEKINAWYGRYASNNGISIIEARKQLSGSELKEFKWDVNEYIKYGKKNALNQQWMKELENASARYHISRLEAIKLQTQAEAEKLFGGVTDEIDDYLHKQYLDRYYHTAYEIQKGTAIGTHLAAVNEKKLDKLINKPWAADEKNFKVRLGESKITLINNIHNSITQMCLNGENPKRAIEQLAKTMNNNKGRAGRIIMTESAFFSSEAQKAVFDELDVEEYEIVATLDADTDETCQGNDGQHHPMSVFRAGVTAPPFHPNCRCCTVPYFNDEFTNGERIARSDDGTAYYVPENMSYRDWKKWLGESSGEKAKDRLNLFSNNNNSDPHYYDATGKSITTVEKELSNNGYETAVIFNKKGKAVSVQLGNDDTIEFTNYQLKLMKNRTVTHNHPLSTPPSPEDLYLLKDCHAKSVRTTGEHGTYVLEYSEEVENLPEFGVMSKYFDDMIETLKYKYLQLPNEKEAIRLLGEEIWDNIYKDFGVKLRFERR